MAPDVYDPTGLAPIGERTLRCIDPSHDEPCTQCNAPPANGEDSFWSLRGDPGKRNGDKKLRTLIQMTREWNSPLERAHLVHYLQNSPEFSHMGKVIEIVRRKETPRLSKMCMMVLARAWGFRSDIWVRKCFSQPFYQCQSIQPASQDDHHNENHPSEPKRQKLLQGAPPSSSGGTNRQSNSQLNRSTSGDISGTETNVSLSLKKEKGGTEMDIKHNSRNASLEVSREQLEKNTLNKFTKDLEHAQECITQVINNTQAACSCCNAMTPQDVSAHEHHKKFCMGSVRSTTDLLTQLKPACEECLNMLEQAKGQSSETLEGKAWMYVDFINHVDKIQKDFEQVFLTGLHSCQPETFSVRCGTKYIREVVAAVSKFHCTTLKLSSIAKSEIAMARNLTLGEFSTICVACVKVFYVVVVEATAKMSDMIQMFDAYNNSVAAGHQTMATQIATVSPHSYVTSTSAALNAPVLSGSVPSLEQTNNVMMPDCLKLLRSLSNEIVLPRSISNEILLPFGLLESLGQGNLSQSTPPIAQPIQKLN